MRAILLALSLQAALPVAAQLSARPAIVRPTPAPSIPLPALAVSLSPSPALSLAAPSLSPAAPALLPPAAALSAPSAAPRPAAGTPAPGSWRDVAVGGREYRLVLRRGADEHGHLVLALDALDKAALGKGTVGHIDFAVNGEHASADGPLDTKLGPHGLPEDVVPAGTDLSHWRPHLWFGLAVVPEHRGTGLGLRLMEEMSALLREQGVQRVFIRATEGSRAFYRRVFGAAVVYEQREEEREGDVYYALEVVL